jgi:signal recognition particle GTPase
VCDTNHAARLLHEVLAVAVQLGYSHTIEDYKHIAEGIYTLRDFRENITSIMKMGPLSKLSGMIYEPCG